MKAIAKVGPQPGAALIEAAEPRPGPGDVLVEVRASGICGTDLHVYLSELGFERRITAFPRILGHEPAGIVRAVGAGVEGFRSGDRVAADPHAACGRCERCRRGRPHLCEAYPLLGSGTRDGALASLVTAPAPSLHHVPDTLDFATAALLEPLTVGVYAADLAQMLPGEGAVVLGPGPIGLMTALAARAAGAEPVVVVGLGVDRSRLGLARRLGFPGVDIESAGAADAIRALVGTEGAAVVFDAAGAPRDALPFVRKGGRVVLIGYPARAFSLDELTALYLRVVMLTPLRMRPESIWDRAIGLVTSGRIDPRPLLTHTLPIEEGLRGFELAASREAVKVQIAP